MAEPTRQAVISKLHTLSELDKAATLIDMTAWARANSSRPEQIINDLESYKEYASKS